MWPDNYDANTWKVMIYNLLDINFIGHNHSCSCKEECFFVSLFTDAPLWYIWMKYSWVPLWYYKILHEWLEELRQNMNQMLDPQNTPITLPCRVSYGVSFVNIYDKSDCIIMARHCTSDPIHCWGAPDMAQSVYINMVAAIHSHHANPTKTIVLNESYHVKQIS